MCLVYDSSGFNGGFVDYIDFDYGGDLVKGRL